MHVIPHTYFVQFPTLVKEISWRVHVIDRIDTLNTLARFKYSATLHKYFCIQSFKLPSKYISSRCGKHLSRHSPPRWRPSWHCAYGNAVKYVPSEAIACVLNRIHNTFCVCQSSISSFWQRWQQNGHENWRLYFGMMCRIPKHTRSAHRALPTIIVENQSCMCSTCSTCTTGWEEIAISSMISRKSTVQSYFIFISSPFHEYILVVCVGKCAAALPGLRANKLIQFEHNFIMWGQFSSCLTLIDVCKYVDIYCKTYKPLWTLWVFYPIFCH